MRRYALLICMAGTFLAGAAQAQPTEYQTTTEWWGKRGRATEGNPSMGYALPVVSGGQLVAALTLVCPRQSERGAFLDIPMSLMGDTVLKGKRVQTILGVNSQAFAGYVDDNRFLIYLNTPQLPALPGMKSGTSVRAAMAESKGVIHIRLDPARPGGIIVRPARLDRTLPALIERLRGQGLQPANLDQVLKTCDAFMKGTN